MAQGGLKKKSVNFSTTSKKSSKHSKPLGPRKGGRTIFYMTLYGIYI